MKENYDVIIVGTGAAGLYCALNLPERTNILMITKQEADQSDSFLAQGGICMLRGEDDYNDYFEDTMRAGHYENDKKAVDLMIRSSNSIIRDLLQRNVTFARTPDGELDFTREGAHSKSRILYHQDVTGKEITSKLLACVQKFSNVELLTQTTMIDILEEKNQCYGIVARSADKTLFAVTARAVVWACGGIGGLYEHSTNFPHLTGDALAIALKHGIELEHPDYVQIHPTTLYSPKPGRRFLISESVRGEGAKLYNAKMERFANEVLPRDLMTAEIRKQMEIDHKPYVWLDMRPLGEVQIKTHFPNIYQKCLEEGFDVTKECIPVVPAQHYFMGGVKVDKYSRTTMKCLYASGETSCNGVHGANRLASNSLLESLVFAKRAAGQITKILETKETAEEENVQNALLKKADATNFLGKEELQKLYAESVRKEIERVREEAV